MNSNNSVIPLRKRKSNRLDPAILNNSYLNVSSKPYNILNNRVRCNSLSMPKLIHTGKHAKVPSSFLRYWNDRSYFNPLRNKEVKENRPKVCYKWKHRVPESVVPFNGTSLPLVSVFKKNDMRNRKRK